MEVPMRRGLLAATLMCILLVAATTRSDVSPSDALPQSLSPAPSPPATPEPITGTAVQPASSETSAKSPLPAYPLPTGKTLERQWHYNKLTAAERTIAD